MNPLQIFKASLDNVLKQGSCVCACLLFSVHRELAVPAYVGTASYGCGSLQPYGAVWNHNLLLYDLNHSRTSSLPLPFSSLCFLQTSVWFCPLLQQTQSENW